MIRITDQYFWNIIFWLFFLALVAMGVIILQSEAYRSYAELQVLDIAIISLASFRLTRLVVFDHSTKFLREQFYDAKVTRAGKVTLYVPKVGPRRAIVAFLSDPISFGLGSVFVVTFFYLLTPLAFVPVLVLALAGVTVFLHHFGDRFM